MWVQTWDPCETHRPRTDRSLVDTSLFGGWGTASTHVGEGRKGTRRMSSIPMPDQRTIYSSRRRDDVDALAWPVFSEHSLRMLRSAGEVLYPEPGALLWDAGDPYDLNLVLAGGVLLLDRRDDRVVFVVEEGDFVGELGMLMGQRAFLPGVAMEGTSLLRVRVEELRKLVEISGELSDVLLSALDEALLVGLACDGHGEVSCGSDPDSKTCGW